MIPRKQIQPLPKNLLVQSYVNLWKRETSAIRQRESLESPKNMNFKLPELIEIKSSKMFGPKKLLLINLLFINIVKQILQKNAFSLRK